MTLPKKVFGAIKAKFVGGKRKQNKIYEDRNSVQEDLMSAQVFNVYKKISEDDDQNQMKD